MLYLILHGTVFMTIHPMRLRPHILNHIIPTWYHTQKKRCRWVHANHPIWPFLREWSDHQDAMLSFQKGQVLFEPIKQTMYGGSCQQITPLWDRLWMHVIYHPIRPCFPHIIHPKCTHLQGPSSIRAITQATHQALNSGSYHYFCRIDIQSYYATIRHDHLIACVHEVFDDPCLLRYLEAIITRPIDKDGILWTPTKGIPRGSSLSPFLWSTVPRRP